EQLRARLVGLLLGIVQRAEGTDLPGTDRVEVEQHRGGDERPGEAASPGFIGTGDEPHAQRTVELEQPASRGNRALTTHRSVCPARCSVRPARGTRSGPGAST